MALLDVLPPYNRHVLVFTRILHFLHSEVGHQNTVVAKLIRVFHSQLETHLLNFFAIFSLKPADSKGGPVKWLGLTAWNIV